MRDSRCDVAVIGGGPAGAAAVVAFARRGCSGQLFERPEHARDPNRGDIRHAPTVEVVRELGGLELLERRGAGRWRGLQIFDSGGISAQFCGDLGLRHRRCRPNLAQVSGR